MRQLSQSATPLVIRTDFENEQAWAAICERIRAPVHERSYTFYAHVDFLDDTEFRNLTLEDLLALLPSGYGHSFLFVVDSVAADHREHPILVVDVGESRGRSFRAIPSQVQGIENNLSTANMDFEEFAQAVDSDGIFRGFQRS